MSLYFDNEKLFDAEGHLTDAGLYALKDGIVRFERLGRDKKQVSVYPVAQ